MDQLLQRFYTKCVREYDEKLFLDIKKGVHLAYKYICVYLPSVWLLENISYLFTDENSGSKQAQIVLQQCKKGVWSKALLKASRVEFNPWYLPIESYL